jgi:hypothetical protein
MKTLLKRALVWLYCHDCISMTTLVWFFDRFQLARH